jgi:hypothetical protein
MNENNSIWRFCLSAFAVWRLTHLVTEEDGPWDVIARLRGRLGSGMLGRLIDCFYCVSLWVALPLAVFTSNGWMGLIVHWLALSGAASLLERSTTRPISVPERDLPRVESVGGDTQCAAVTSEAF